MYLGSKLNDLTTFRGDLHGTDNSASTRPLLYNVRWDLEGQALRNRRELLSSTFFLSSTYPLEVGLTFLRTLQIFFNNVEEILMPEDYNSPPQGGASRTH